MKKIFAATFLSFLALALFSAPTPANAGVCVCSDNTRTVYPCDNAAQCANTLICPANLQPSTCDTSAAAPTGPSGTAGSGTTASGELKNPLEGICPKGTEGQKCVQLVLGSVIKTLLGIVGSIALLMAVYGGFLWLTSMGNESKVETGKKTLIWSILGLVLIFGSYALVSYIFSVIAK